MSVFSFAVFIISLLFHFHFLNTFSFLAKNVQLFIHIILLTYNVYKYGVYGKHKMQIPSKSAFMMTCIITHRFSTCRRLAWCNS